MLTQSRLKELLHYDPDTGVFTWSDAAYHRVRGRVAGVRLAHGYIVIGVDKTQYRAHQLAWLYVHGCFPSSEIDHKDANPSNNAVNNLRLATRSQQQWNHRKRRNCTSFYKGVWFDKDRKKWRSAIEAEGRRKDLGRFASPALAHLAYCRAAKKYHKEFANFG